MGGGRHHTMLTMVVQLLRRALAQRPLLGRLQSLALGQHRQDGLRVDQSEAFGSKCLFHVAARILKNHSRPETANVSSALSILGTADFLWYPTIFSLKFGYLRP